jgi:hypothetical protein
MRYNYRDYESPGAAVRSSADDVRVKQQKPDRPMLDGPEKKACAPRRDSY